MNKLAIALSAALSMGAAASAHAADATITFTGKVVASTCSVDIGGGGSTATVPLRQINAGAFKTDDTVGSTPFTITLTAAGSGTATCSKDNARLYIDTATSNLTADGMIENMETGSPTSAVVKLLDADNGDRVIDLSDSNDVSLVRTKASSKFEYNLIARYHNPTAADLTEGDFSGKLAFDVDNY
ncbi:fimbrial protein [Stenotrophomonas hibiscicola]|uniref:fimbrial protein n=1 Tax=Stenotrophomonas hibiscicola TaxID=86189 RepID=UPI00320FED72